MELKEFLCQNHNDALFLLKELKRYTKSIDMEYKDRVFYVNTIQNIEYIIRHCKKQGQRMENRLRKYRYAIEKLGFKRVKKTK